MPRLGLIFIAAALLSSPVHASMFKGEALDTAADVLAWVVLILPPAPGSPCSAAEFRQFDFWVGEWDVTSGGGRPRTVEA